jgi:hypothetical protein
MRHPRQCTIHSAHHRPSRWENDGHVALSRRISFCIVPWVTAVFWCETEGNDQRAKFLSWVGWFSLKSGFQDLSKWNDLRSTRCWSSSKFKFASSVPSKRYQQLVIWLRTNVSIAARFCKPDWANNIECYELSDPRCLRMAKGISRVTATQSSPRISR